MKLSDQIPAKLRDQFRQAIHDQVKKMSSENAWIAQELLKDSAVVRCTFLTWLNPEAYKIRFKVYDQIPLIEDRGHLVKLFLNEKRPLPRKTVAALIHDLDRCYSVDQRKRFGAKESVSKLRRIYSQKALEKIGQRIIWKDHFPLWSQETKKDREMSYYDFRLYFKPRNRQWFENVFDLAAIWSIQNIYLNGMEPDLFERKENQKDILITVYDVDGQNLNYKQKPFSAFMVEKYKPLIKRMAKEYAYSREIEGSEKEVENVISKIWFDSIFHYKKGKETIPAYFNNYLREFFFGEDKIEMIDSDSIKNRSHFIDDFIRRFIERLKLKDETDEIISLNFDRSLSETQAMIKEALNKDISLMGISKRKNKIRVTLKRQLKMAKIIADEARQTIPAMSDLPEFDEKDYSKA